MSESSPLLPSSTILSPHETAAWILDTTIRDAPVYNYETIPRTRKKRQRYLFFENTQIVRDSVVVLLVFLSLFELPSHCSAAKECIAPDGSNMYLSGVPYLKVWEQMSINAVFLAILGFFFIYDLLYFPHATLHVYHNSLGWVLGALVVDFFWVAFWSGYPPFRPAPFIRAILPLFYWHALREVTLGIGAVIAPFLDVVAFVIIFTLFFGWMVTIVFHDSNVADQYFGNLAVGLYSAFTSMTTADWPMQVMGILDANRIYALVFLAFIIIGVFLLLNVLLAVVYNAYTEHIEGVVEGKLKARLTNINIAYTVLTESSPVVTLDDIHQVFDELRKNKKMVDVSEEQVDLIFTAMDDNADSQISRGEFLDVVDLLQLQFVEEFEQISPVEQYLPRLYATQLWQTIARTARSKTFSYVLNAVMICNLVVIIFETTMDLRGHESPSFTAFFAWVECGFSLFYIVEILVRIACQGFDRYWKDYGNRFDCILTPVLLIGAGYVLLPGSKMDDDIVRYLVILRCLRLFQLLSDIPRFRRLTRVFAIMIPASVPLFSFFFLSLFVFAAAAVELFGGLIYAGNPALDPKLHPLVDAYVDSDFWVLNFNDIAAGWYTLFTSAIVGYLTEIVEVIASASSYGDLTRWYFIFNFVVNGLIVSNCVVAFVVDLFISVDEDPGDARIRALQDRYGSKRVNIMYKSMNSDQIFSTMFRGQLESGLGAVASADYHTT